MTPRKLVDYIEKTSRVHGKRIQGVEIYNKYSFVKTELYSEGRGGIYEVMGGDDH